MEDAAGGRLPAPAVSWTGGPIRLWLLRPLARLPGPVFLALLRPVQWIYERTGGRVGSRFTGVPILLLRTHGRVSRRQRTSALVYATDGWRVAVVASKAGDPRPPSWLANLLADSEAEVQVATARWRVAPHVAVATERRIWWARMVRLWPFDLYESRAHRELPVVVLEPQP